MAMSRGSIEYFTLVNFQCAPDVGIGTVSTMLCLETLALGGFSSCQMRVLVKPNLATVMCTRSPFFQASPPKGA